MTTAQAAPPDNASESDGPAETAGFRLPHRTKMLILGGALLAMFLSAMETTVVTTAIPRIVSQLGGLHLIAWMTTSFLLTSLIAVPIAGRLSDVYGRKPFLLGGLTVFLLGSTLSGFADSMAQLIAFRAVQGLGAGVLMANTMVISGDLFPPRERGKYIGLFASVFGVSAIIGPTLGGFLTDELSWRWVFWINLPLGVFSVLVIGFKMPWLRPPPRKVHIDYCGVVTLIWALVPGLIALSLVGSGDAWGDSHILLLFLASAIGLPTFLLAERRAREPILPLQLFRNRTFAIVALVFFGLGAGLFGVTFFIPLFVQGVIGKTATESGTIITPELLSVVVFAGISGQIISRTGRYKYVALVGAATMLVGVLTMTQMSTETSFVGVIWRLVIFGAGMGLLFPVLTLAVQNALPQSMLGTVSGSTQFFQSVGGLVGITVFGTLLNKRVSSQLSEQLPADLAAVADPQQLIDPGQRGVIIDQIGLDSFLIVADAMRDALASAITGNFYVSIGVGIIVFAALLAMKELRLRTAEDTENAPHAFVSEDPEPSSSETQTPDQTRSEVPTAPAFAQSRDIVPSTILAAPAPAPAVEQSVWRHLVERRLPPLPDRPPARGGVIGALLLGAALGLAVGFGNRDTDRRPRPAQRGFLARTRRRLADRLDPPRRS